MPTNNMETDRSELGGNLKRIQDFIKSEYSSGSMDHVSDIPDDKFHPNPIAPMRTNVYYIESKK